MPVHNGARYLAEAIDSVLAQSFRDFELLVIDDGSTDSTGEILAGYRDPRLRVETNSRNLGLIASLNLGIELARGRFIARMDADDSCYRARLKVQLDFMEARPEVGVVGSWYRPMGRHNWGRVVRMPTMPSDIDAWMLFHCPIAHPTVLIRRNAFVRNELHYDPRFLHAEDYDLWSRASVVTRLANVPVALLRYRVHGGQITARYGQVQSASGRSVRRRELAKLKADVSDSEAELHNQIATSTFTRDAPTLDRIAEWLLLLVDQNRKRQAFDEPSFKRIVGKIWMRAALDCMPSAWACLTYARSPLTVLSGRRFLSLAGFGARTVRDIVVSR